MSTVVRMFLNKETASQITEILKQLEVRLIDYQPTNGSTVVNIFDPEGYEKLRKINFSKSEQAIMVTTRKLKSNYLNGVYNNLKLANVSLLGLLDLSDSSWKFYLKYLIGG